MRTIAPETPLPWYHRHPAGGNEIYPDGETFKPLATFNNEADCDYAIAAANLFPKVLAALIIARNHLDATGANTADKMSAEHWNAITQAIADCAVIQPPTA